MSERDMRSLIALLEKQLGISWDQVIEWLRGQNSLAAIEERLVSGDLSAVIAEVTTAAEKFAAEVNSAMLTSGQRSAAYLDSKLADTLVHFDSAYPSVVRRARENTYTQVYGLTEETRQNLNAVITDGVQRGTAPREVARRIRDSIGLTEPQERALANYRRALEQGDFARATGYELRDARSDRTFRDAEGKLRRDVTLTQEQVDSLAERYRRNAIAQRAETIARTEALAAANNGAHDAIRQAIDRGDVDADQLVVEWHSGPATKHARKDHRHMNGKTVPFGTDFILPDGTPMSGPGDERGGAKHLANCRCTSSITFGTL